MSILISFGLLLQQTSDNISAKKVVYQFDATHYDGNPGPQLSFHLLSKEKGSWLLIDAVELSQPMSRDKSVPASFPTWPPSPLREGHVSIENL